MLCGGNKLVNAKHRMKNNFMYFDKYTLIQNKSHFVKKSVFCA